MAPNTAASASPAPLKQDWQEYTFADLRASRHSSSQRLVAIHGNVYDVGTFISRHPGGAIINTAVGRDATILFETHHALVDKGIDSVRAVLRKYQVGVMQGEYTPVANFETPFARALIQAVREVTTGQNRRDSLYAYSSVAFFYFSFALTLWLTFTTQALWAAVLLGITMSVGHVCGHAGNHWSLSSLDWVNAAVSATCTNLWGLREKYWEFSHLISHHCFNYTDRDYIMEQHVPMAYFRVRESDPWRPRHAYQHYVYLSTFFTSFLLGAVRLDCAPWVFVAPLLAGLRRNADSPAPAPQFFASGSNTAEKDVAPDQDGVGPDSFLVFDSWQSNAVSLLLSNVIWLPLFLSTWRRQQSLLYAILLNSVAFGTQAVIVTKNLLTQHMCEDIVLKPQYRAADCWYGLQVEASTSVDKAPFAMWLSYAISYQTEHHMFPSLNPRLLVAIQPVVERVSKEHGVRYHHLPSEAAALRSVYNQFKRLSVQKGE